MITLTTKPPIRLSHNAIDTIRNAGMTDRDVQRDIELLRSGATDPKTLLNDCFNNDTKELCGEEDLDSIRSGWEEYVKAVEIAAFTSSKGFRLQVASRR